MADGVLSVNRTHIFVSTDSADGAVHIGEILDRWHAIGSVRGLQSDADIASFLMRYYEDTWRNQQSAALCLQCHTPLTLCCLKCSPRSTTVPHTTHSATSNTTLHTHQTAGAFLWTGEKPGVLGGAGDVQHDATDVSKRLTALTSDGGVRESCHGKCDDQHRGMGDKQGTQPHSLSEKATHSLCEKIINGAGLNLEYDPVKETAAKRKEECDHDSREERPDSRPLDNIQDTSTSGAESSVGRNKNSGCPDLTCLVCSQLFTEPDQLTVHMQGHSAEMTNKCEFCGASFFLPDIFQLHKKTHAPQSVKNRVGLTSVTHPFPEDTGCTQIVSCSDVQVPKGGKTLGEGSQMRNRPNESNSQEDHRKADSLAAVSNSYDEESGIYEGDTDTEHDFCNSSCAEHWQEEADTATEQGRKKTTTLIETGQQQANDSVISCEISDANLEENSEMQNLMENIAKTLSSVSSGQCGCQYCGVSFKSLDTLVTHARSHYRTKEEECSVCHKTFDTSGLLEMHQHRSLRCKPKATRLMNQCDQRSKSHSTPKSPQHVKTHIKKLREGKRMALSCRLLLNDIVIDPKLSAKDQLIYDASSKNCSTAQEHQLLQKTEGRRRRRKFQCGHCGKELCNRQTLAAHERTHTGAKPFQCPQCPSAFRSNSNLRAHLRTHSGHTPYLCPQCGRGFKEITHLKRHLVSHSGERPHKCQLCGKAYVHATSLKEHMLSHSSAPKGWVCHQCGKAFANSKKLKVHLKTHASKGEGSRRQEVCDRRFACQVCGAVYQQASSLSRHKKLHEVGARPYNCSDCGKTFRDKYELRKHGRTHSRLNLYKCDQCSRSFRAASGYRRHLLSHSGLKPHICSKCQKRYADPKSLKHHLQTHTGIRPHCCSQCSKRFFTPWTLRLHLQRHAMCAKSPGFTEEKSHICHQCGAAYLRASSLVRHQRLHEAAEGHTARYQCSQCSRSFGDSSHLKRHQLSHSGEKPFVCASCGKAYADSHTLKDHMQVHTGIRSFVCETCGKRFFNAKTLKEHARSHSDQRPFQCLQCSAAYKHLSGLISHRRQHSGVRPFRCGECGKTFKDYTCHKRHQLTHTHHKPHVCQQCGKAYKDLKNLKHHQAQLHGHSSQ